MFRIQLYEALRFQKTAHYLRKFNISVVAIFTVTLIGIVGFIVIEKYSLSESFYMTVITISTVGYGEVRALSELGRGFASFLILANMGVVAYAVSTVSSFIIEGELQKYLKDYRIFKKIQTLENHVIVCGFGRHGQEIAQEFIKNGIPFVVIERDKQKISEMRLQQDFLFLEGEATHDQILLEAGIMRAKALISTLGEDADNVYITLSAKQLNPNLQVISRAVDKKAEIKLKRVGADHVVLPERLGGFYMATLVRKPEVVEFFTLISNMGAAEILFEEVECEKLSDFHLGRSIRELNIRTKTGVNIIGLRSKDGKYTVNPSPEILLSEGMRLVILGDSQQIEKFNKIMFKQ